MLWNDSTVGSPTLTEVSWTNEKEKELLENMKRMGRESIEGDGEGQIGIITPKMPHSYFNLMCFMIAYKTGTSLKDIMKMSLFDFASYLYIVGKINEEQGSSANGNPTEKELHELGLG